MEGNLVLYYGENEYEQEAAIRKAAEEGGLEQKDVVDNVDFADLINLLNTPALFGGATLYVVRNAGILGDRNNLERLEAYLGDPSPFSKAIIVAVKKPDARKKPNAFDLLAKAKLVREFPLVKGKALQKWIKEYCWHHGYNIDEAGVSYLIEVVGEDQAMLRSEMDKYFLFQPEGKQIRVADLEQIVSSNVEYNIFALTDNLFGNRARMLDALESLYRLKEPVVKILFMIIKEIRYLVRFKWLLKEGRGEEQLAGMFKMHPYVAKKKCERARRMSYEELFRTLKLFYEVEERIKTGRGEEKALLRTTLLSLK